MSTVAYTPHLIPAKKSGLGRAFISDATTGRQLVDIRASHPTYSASFSIVPAGSATDVVELKGSATKRIAVKRIIISGVQTTAGQVLIDLVLRSTASSGGTSTAPTIVKHAQARDAATATIKAFTANPTVGTLIGSARKVRVPIGAATSLVPPTVLTFGDAGEELVLSGVTQVLCLNLAGVTVTGGTLDVTIEFIEESLT